MPVTRVGSYERRVGGKVVQVTEHAREIASAASDSGPVRRGPAVGNLHGMEEFDFQQLVLERASRPLSPELSMRRRRNLQKGEVVEFVFLAVKRPGRNNFGQPKQEGFSFVHTGEQIGKEASFRFLEQKLEEEFGPDAEIDRGFSQYQRWTQDKFGQPVFDDTDLPEWLKEENPRVPTADVLAAAEHFTKKTKGTPIYGKTVAIAGEFPGMEGDAANVFVETLGAEVADTISADVDVLIADPESKEVKKAQSLGIPVVSPEEVAGYPEKNLVAWRTEMYRRYRRGTREHFVDKYSTHAGKDFKTMPGEAKTHEEALAAAEMMLECAHSWGDATRVDNRNPVLRTGEMSSVRECARCGKTDTKVSQRNNWSGD